MARKIVAIVGTYRRGRVIETAVDELLAAARQEGAETEKIMLLDRHVEFCTNCRACTQVPGQRRGDCPLNDDMDDILDMLETADGIVLASPINCGNVTAIMKRFIERLLCYAYWPWNIRKAPQKRIRQEKKKAVVITASMCPAFIARLLMGNSARTMKGVASFMGAKTINVLHMGFVAISDSETLSERYRQASRKQGIALARAI